MQIDLERNRVEWFANHLDPSYWTLLNGRLTKIVMDWKEHMPPAFTDFVALQRRKL